MTVAVVTGGSRGIGAATCRALSKRGFDVCLSFRDDEAAAMAVVEACGGRAHAVQVDVAVEADVLALFTAADQLGPLGVLVNNAGIVGPKARLDELSVERIARMLGVNVVGAFVCAREAVRRMSTRFGGAGGHREHFFSRGSDR